MTRLDRWLARPALPAVLLATLLLALCELSGMVQALDHQLFDAATRIWRARDAAPLAHDVVVVGLDDEFVRAIPEPLSLSHAYLGRFLAAASGAGASVIGLDLALPEKSFRDLANPSAGIDNYDLALLRGLLTARRRTPVILGNTWEPAQQAFRPVQLDFLAAASGPPASLMVCTDGDGVLRETAAARCQPDATHPPLAIAVAEHLGVAAGPAMLSRSRIDFSRGPAISYLPLSRVLAWAAADNQTALRNAFAGHPVLLGPVFPFEDRIRLPVPLAAFEPGKTLLPGVLVHAQWLRNLLGPGTIKETPAATGWAGAALLLLLALVSQRVARRLLAIALLLSLPALALLGFRQLYWLPVAPLLLAALAALLAREALDALHALREKRRLRRAFGGYVSPMVLRDILDGRLTPSSAGVRTHACVLFADIRGFTARSEGLAPEAVIDLLNAYFPRMTQAIHAQQGTVDKFIGDGIMALFGAPHPLACPESNALAAALAMLTALDELNRELRQRGLEPVAIGIGLHSGPVVSGHIGSRDRNEYTAIGDTVNTASRVEGLTKETGTVLLVSAAVHAAIPDADKAKLLDLGEWPLKGRSPLRLFGLRDPSGGAPSAASV